MNNEMYILDSCTDTLAYQVFREIPNSPPPYPHAPNNMIPLKAEPRVWLHAEINGFRPHPMEQVYVSHMLALRSDGQFFYVATTVKSGFSKTERDPAAFVADRLHKAYEKLKSFRDCSCGIIGHELTDELDEDGDPILRAVNSPCELHPKDGPK